MKRFNKPKNQSSLTELQLGCIRLVSDIFSNWDTVQVREFCVQHAWDETKLQNAIAMEFDSSKTNQNEWSDAVVKNKKAAEKAAAEKAAAEKAAAAKASTTRGTSTSVRGGRATGRGGISTRPTRDSFDAEKKDKDGRERRGTKDFKGDATNRRDSNKRTDKKTKPEVVTPPKPSWAEILKGKPQEEKKIEQDYVMVSSDDAAAATEAAPVVQWSDIPFDGEFEVAPVVVEEVVAVVAEPVTIVEEPEVVVAVAAPVVEETPAAKRFAAPKVVFNTNTTFGSYTFGAPAPVVAAPEPVVEIAVQEVAKEAPAVVSMPVAAPVSAPVQQQQQQPQPTSAYETETDAKVMEQPEYSNPFPVYPDFSYDEQDGGMYAGGDAYYFRQQQQRGPRYGNYPRKQNAHANYVQHPNAPAKDDRVKPHSMMPSGYYPYQQQPHHHQQQQQQPQGQGKPYNKAYANQGQPKQKQHPMQMMPFYNGGYQYGHMYPQGGFNNFPRHNYPYGGGYEVEQQQEMVQDDQQQQPQQQQQQPQQQQHQDNEYGAQQDHYRKHHHQQPMDNNYFPRGYGNQFYY